MTKRWLFEKKKRIQVALNEKAITDQFPKFETRIGAEAVIELCVWHDKPAIMKSRIPKAYRLPELDARLRKKRTAQEIQIIHLSKLFGIHAPEVYFADPIRSEIVMSYVPGHLLKDLISSLRRVDLHVLFLEFGRDIGRIHSRGLIHGDLTTSNLIASGDSTYLIDYGLSFISSRIEDKAEDIHLLKQSLNTSADPKTARFCLQSFLRGYRQIIKPRPFNLVLGQIRRIELRGRYAQVD